MSGLNELSGLGTIVLAAGGTGGHLFPAQALSAELLRRGASIVIMTDSRSRQYGAQFPGAEIANVPSAAFSDRSPLRLVAAPFEIIAGVLIAFARLLRLRPAAVVGFGGYPSVPVMIAACLARFPTAIIEQNAVIGRANRLVMNYVRLVATAFPLARFAPKNKSKIILTGNPLRAEVLASAHVPYAAPVPGGSLRLLIFGGSQGARALSHIVPAAITMLPQSVKTRLVIEQQCRPEDIEIVRTVYANSEVRAELATFFADLPSRMAGAHLVIARAGAGTVAELMALGRPAILVPLPHALDDNQTPNADILARANAGWRVAERDLSPEILAQMLLEIFADPAGLARRADAARSLAIPDATRRLADAIEHLARASTKEAA